MANYILFDDATRRNLLPLTFTRPIADLRVGILTIREKWEKALKKPVTTLTTTYMQESFPMKWEKSGENVFINAAILPSQELILEIKKLTLNEAIVDGDVLIAAKSGTEHPYLLLKSTTERIPLFNNFKLYTLKTNYTKINFPWDIFVQNGDAIEYDFELLTQNRESQILSTTNTTIHPERIFIEEGAEVEGAFLNASKGVIYIGKNAKIMEGSMIRGPFALCENGIVKMGAKIYGATTIGPFAKVGGEISNSVIWGYSNKGHDGYLGNSVIGAWCNLGADTNSSNLKNNYSSVKVWNYRQRNYVPSEQQFCGLIMGDHAKSGINTMFNTGTVVGVAANVFGAGFPPKFIPSFSWGGGNGFTTHRLNKAINTAQRMYAQRNLAFSRLEEEVLEAVFEQTNSMRNF